MPSASSKTTTSTTSRGGAPQATSPPTVDERLRSRIALLAILLIAGILRLGWCDRAPAGLQVDEASNAWNAWCILNSFHDEHRTFLPIFYTEAFGDNRSALFLYFLLPFQLIGGLNECTTRMPAGFAGVAAVALVYVVGSRLFDRRLGLIAAALLAVDPWHVQQSRWGHEASITPMLVLGTLAMLAAARLLPGTGKSESTTSKGDLTDRKPRPFMALLAGLLAGVSCYGYAAIRVYLPVLLIALVVLCWRHWRTLFRTRSGNRALGTLTIGFVVPFLPLVCEHLIDPDINLRARTTWVWEPGDSIPTRAIKALSRYPMHFSPDFLFIHGSTDPATSPPHGFGQIQWYALPFLLIGLWKIARSARSSWPARFTLVAVLLYPIGDLLNRHAGANVLRSLPGAWALVLLAAIGVVTTLDFLKTWRGDWLVRPAAVAIGLAIAFCTGLYVYALFTRFDDEDVARWHARNRDLEIAAKWVKPKLARADAVCWSQEDFSYIYAPVFVFVGYDTRTWFEADLVRAKSMGDKYANADLVLKTGKMHFLFPHEFIQKELTALVSNARQDYVILILRPEEAAAFIKKDVAPSLEIRDPSGKVTLNIYEIAM